MSMDARQLLAALSTEHWLGGPELAAQFGVSRAAVSKRLHGLRDDGWPVVADSARGYRLARPLDLLDAAAVGRACPEVAVDSHLSLPSTSDHLLARDFDGPRLCLAEHQTGGRGRRGRQWATQPGANLTLSLDWRFDQPQAPLTGLSPAVAALLTRALDTPAIGIKWPNDLVVGGQGALRKLGGILIDATGEPGGPTRVVIGIGINVHMQAADIDQPWVALASLRPDVRRTALCIALVSALVEGLPQFERGGLAAFLPDYAGRDVLSGREVQIDSAGQTLAGTAGGLAPDGGLHVRLRGGGRRTLYAGDVSVRAA